MQVLAVGLLVLGAGWQDEGSPPPVEDAVVEAAWDSLSAGQKGEAIAWFQAELDRRNSFQNQLMRHVFFSLDHGRRKWPVAGASPVFDAAHHCPAQPIERKVLPEDDPRAIRERAAMFENVPDRPMDRAWRYDWGRGSVVRVADPDDPDRIFRNALAGIPPELDLAEAIVIGMLDDGSQREAHAAFGHLYADRNGRAFPGVTLYDAWCSGRELEMPDVETLGLLHTLDGDWKTYVAPVPPRQHDKLYGRLGAMFEPLRRQRGLATALARAYLQGTPALRDGYASSVGRLHFAWELRVSDPARMRAELPDVSVDKKWSAWFKTLDRTMKRDKEAAGRAASRQATLLQEAVQVRAILVAVLQEMSALER